MGKVSLEFFICEEKNTDNGDKNCYIMAESYQNKSRLNNHKKGVKVFKYDQRPDKINC